jgi:hypothetical protein
MFLSSAVPEVIVRLRNSFFNANAIYKLKEDEIYTLTSMKLFPNPLAKSKLGTRESPVPVLVITVSAQPHYLMDDECR